MKRVTNNKIRVCADMRQVRDAENEAARLAGFQALVRLIRSSA